MLQEKVDKSHTCGCGRNDFEEAHCISKVEKEVFTNPRVSRKIKQNKQSLLIIYIHTEGREILK